MVSITTRILRFLFVPLAVVASTIATSELIPVNLEELSNQAEFVVVGRVTGQEARFNDSETMILTYTTIEVDQVLAGYAPTSFEIAEYGGRVGNQGVWASGQVIYEEGEQVLVFVCQDALGLLRTCGAQQGRMRVRTQADGSLTAAGRMAGETVDGSVQGLQTRIHDARRSSR